MRGKGLVTKQKLYDVAIDLINERGYDNVTVDEVCKAAGVAKGTFYIYYPTKDEIIRESYYSLYGTYVSEHYERFLDENPDADLYDRILTFALIELEYTVHTGVEICSRAFSANFANCAPGTAEHLRKRSFSTVLHDLVGQIPGVDEAKAFLDIETIVRGYQASWCFRGGDFDIVEEGERLLRTELDKLFGRQGASVL